MGVYTINITVMRICEITTSLGHEYERLYTQYYKRAHYRARQLGFTGAEADLFARRALDAYKLRIRTGKYDPITKKHNLPVEKYR